MTLSINKLYITQQMRGKMKGFKSLNTSPMVNPFCNRMSQNPENICSRCYSRKSIQSFHHDGRWIDNGVILTKHRVYDAQIPKIKTPYFRFHAHGELLNIDHLWHLYGIARLNPDTQFALWSKRKDIVNTVYKFKPEMDDYIIVRRPTNLNVIYSDPKINSLSTEIPPGFDKKFNVFTKEFAEENNIDLNCAGINCMECLVCYKTNDITLINELLR